MKGGENVTELQKLFLLGVFIYYLFKGSLYVVLYVSLIIVERNARLRWKKIRKMLTEKRAYEQERWRVAYSLYEKEKGNPTSRPLDLSQLVKNPNSFTAYSDVKYCV